VDAPYLAVLGVHEGLREAQRSIEEVDHEAVGGNLARLDAHDASSLVELAGARKEAHHALSALRPGAHARVEQAEVQVVDESERRAQ
jgi:hypothetical protein